MTANLIVCKKCGAEKPVEEFSICRHVKTGRCGACKACARQNSKKWYQANKARRRATSNAWKEANPERYSDYCKTYNKRYREEHPDTVKAAKKLWRENNPEKIRANDRRRYWRDPEKRNAISKRQRRENPEHVRALDRAAYKRNKDRKNAWKDVDRRQRIAVDTGKSSPIFKRTGFALVSDGKHWRAARLGIPWDRSERAFALFKFWDGHWLIYNPPIATSDINLINRLRRREKRLSSPGCQYPISSSKTVT